VHRDGYLERLGCFELQELLWFDVDLLTALDRAPEYKRTEEHSLRFPEQRESDLSTPEEGSLRVNATAR
jgi:hypothetical protein